MTAQDTRARALAILLAALAGYVDAFGFLATGGFFLSFMSGNSTRLGIGLTQDAARTWVTAAALIGAFLLGVVAGALAGSAVGSWRRAVVLLLSAALLAAAAALGAAGAATPCSATLAAAMGVENNVFERNGEVSLGLTYMTGNLVKLGQRIAAALRGGNPLGWVPNLLLWSGFVLGAAGGATLYPILGSSGLWGAAAAAAVLALAAAGLDRAERAAPPA